MADTSQDTHPDELRSDLDMLIEMARNVEHDERAIHGHLESLKTKLDAFVHGSGDKSGGSAAS